MLQRTKLARESLFRALTVRRRLSTHLDHAVSPIAIAEALMLDVRFVDLPSMEGIYVAGNDPKIILSCLRPQGRRHFTCAHEIGHHDYGHGQQFDEIVDHRSARRRVDPQEFSADCFASYLLMPKTAVDSGMARRQFRYNTMTVAEAYAVSSWLGVGYATFINHLVYGLKVLSRERGASLLKVQPITIRSELTGGIASATQLHVVDRHWLGRAVDCEEGDYLLCPKGTMIEGASLARVDSVKGGDLIAVRSPGLGRVSQGWPLWSAFIRVSRQKYVGRSIYRFEEEMEE